MGRFAPLRRPAPCEFFCLWLPLVTFGYPPHEGCSLDSFQMRLRALRDTEQSQTCIPFREERPALRPDVCNRCGSHIERTQGRPMLKGTLSHMKDRSLKRIGAARPSWVCLRRFGAPPLANSFAFGYLWLPLDTLHTKSASLVHSFCDCVRCATPSNPNMHSSPRGAPCLAP